MDNISNQNLFLEKMFSSLSDEVFVVDFELILDVFLIRINLLGIHIQNILILLLANLLFLF